MLTDPEAGDGICLVCFTQRKSTPDMVHCGKAQCKTVAMIFARCLFAWWFISRDEVLCDDIKRTIGATLANICHIGAMEVAFCRIKMKPALMINEQCICSTDSRIF